METGLIGGVEKREITIVNYNDDWPLRFAAQASIIRDALGDTAVRVEHIGSTSVPGLAAKPIIDILVEVPNSGDESTYVPALVEAGYRLRVREPEWNEHRMLRTPELDVHVHVYSSDCPEIARLLAFRDRLRENANYRLCYEEAKRKLAEADWKDMNEYADAKTDMIEKIISASLPASE